MKGIFPKNKVLIIILGVIVIVIAVFAVYRIMNPIYTFDDITNNKAELVDRIESRECSEEFSADLYDVYKNRRYKKCKPDSYGLTSNSIFQYFDKDNNLLFKVESISNNVLIVTVDGTITAYMLLI